MSYEKIEGTPNKIRMYYVTDLVYQKVAKKTSFKAASVVKEGGQIDFERIELSEDEKEIMLDYMAEGLLEIFSIFFKIISGNSVINNSALILSTTEHIAAGLMEPGKYYTIITPNVSTDFTLYGAADNEAGTVFLCTEAGTGTGTVKETLIASYVDLKDNAKYRTINLDLLDKRIENTVIDFILYKWYVLRGLVDDAAIHKQEHQNGLAAISQKSLALRIF